VNPDPDPDPRIHTSDYWIRIQILSSVAFWMQKNDFFIFVLLIDLNKKYFNEI
jgi:hypothetical protein